MATLLSQKEPVARKEYNCMASNFIRESGNLRGLTFTFSEWRAIITARENNWNIIPGEKYIRQAIAYDGSVYTFIAIPAIHEICLKYEFYPDD